MLRVSLLPRFPVSASIASKICRSAMSGTPKPICPNFISLVDGEDNSRVISNGFKFRLVSYNILAQVYVKSSYFPHSPSSCLKWRARSQAILTELKHLNADFLCIQELDEYDSFYKSNMENHGYSCIYLQRTGQKRDGCGIFYKLNSAELVLNEEIHYNDLVNSIGDGNGLTQFEKDNTSDVDTIKGSSVGAKMDSLDDCGDPNDPCVRLKRDCVGLLAAFKLNDPSHHLIVVANTHIYWDPEWADVKLAQVKYLSLRIAKFAEVVSVKYGCTPSVVVAGDFNSTPGDEVYQYLVSADAAPTSSGVPLRLCSLYGVNGGEPPFTNCTPDFTATLDYIFLSNTAGVKPVSLLQLPGPESDDVIGCLPNHYHPSDHLPIGADFEVLGTSSSPVTSEPCKVEADLKKLKIEK